MNDNLEEVSWNAEPLLIQAVEKNRNCIRCQYVIWQGTSATKTVGAYQHYPDCPESARENRKIRDAARIGGT